MDPSEFDRLIARAENPRLIPGIYNYCDGRCPRCPFTDRCLTYLDNQETDAGVTASREQASLAERVGATLRRTLDMLAEIGRRKGIDLGALSENSDAEAAKIEAAFKRHYDDPIVVRSREYAHVAWRIAQALGPLVAARGDPLVIEAVETIEWFSTLISSKVYRAVAGQAECWHGGAGEDMPADHDGSAKVALIGIAESRDSWRILMEHGKATADGVPAQAVRMLDALEAGIHKRFPQATAFIRPGFDEPNVAAGAPATRPPLARRRGRDSRGGE
jgi:hypothetical protein